MDIASFAKIDSIAIVEAYNKNLAAVTSPSNVDHSAFDTLLSSAINNIGATNAYISEAENEEIRWALGETANTHDLTNALQKASVALQYTVAIRDKLLEAYKEIMQMQI